MLEGGMLEGLCACCTEIVREHAKKRARCDVRELRARVERDLLKSRKLTAADLAEAAIVGRTKMLRERVPVGGPPWVYVPEPGPRCAASTWSDEWEFLEEVVCGMVADAFTINIDQPFLLASVFFTEEKAAGLKVEFSAFVSRDEGVSFNARLATLSDADTAFLAGLAHMTESVAAEMSRMIGAGPVVGGGH